MPLTRLFLLAFLVGVLAAPRAYAQAGRDDQPGYVPSAEEEQLDPKWEKTVVFFRTTEPPGTIVVNTNERFLYLV
jgi:lipoprotein-anchoring transpeptidase ErfK/SrfK